ncbi:TPA: UbiX family flavin prenyltransferase [Candidatus Micrarchaeota archaeon]|nr:UbiX family flavin prenyltransferase [Candidatus Micrarchaeota archaeon]
MRFLIAITGASGLIYGTRLVEILRKQRHNVAVVVSNGAVKVAKAENAGGKLPKSDFEENNLSAPFASGSYVCKNLDAMMICPCSLKTLGEIANGVGSNLIARAAEVCLKERRKLVLVIRETPLSYIAIKNMETVTLAGAVVLPACPGFYGKPKTISDLVDFVVGKVLDQIGVENKLFKRWKE